MKKSLKNIFLFRISVLCCLLTGLYGTDVYGLPETFSLSFTSGYISPVTTVSSDSYCQTAQALISTVSGNAIVSVNTVRNNFSGCIYFAVSKANGFNRTNALYILHPGNIQLRFTQTDIIFPFHYFW